jgi:hypothetical protein
MLTLLLVWSTTLMHGVWLAADGVVRLGYGSRSALWTNFGSEFRIFNGARTFQALLVWLAEEGHIIGDLASKKLKVFSLPNPVTHVQRPLKRLCRSILIDVFSGFQSLAYLAATLSLTYVSIDISAVLVAGTSSFSATLVQDLSLLHMARLSSAFWRYSAYPLRALPSSGALPRVAPSAAPMPSTPPSRRSDQNPATIANTASRIQIALSESVC